MQGKYSQAVSAKAGGCSSGSSSSSGAENQKYRDPEAEIREELKRFKNEEKKQVVQDEPAGEEGRFEEDGKMKVDEEVAIKKKLDERKKVAETVARPRKIHRYGTTFDGRAKKKSGSRSCKIFEQRRHDLLPGAPKDAEEVPIHCKVCRKKEAIPKRTLGNATEKWSRSETELLKETLGPVPRAPCPVPRAP